MHDVWQTTKLEVLFRGITVGLALPGTGTSVLTRVPLARVSYQNTSLFRNLAKYTNIPHVCCPNFDSIPIYLILGVRYTNIPHVFWKFQQYTNIPHAWFGRAKRAYQYTSCFRKMAKYTNIPQFNEYQETITSPLLYRYLPYIICAQCMNNVIWIFLVNPSCRAMQHSSSHNAWTM